MGQITPGDGPPGPTMGQMPMTGMPMMGTPMGQMGQMPYMDAPMAQQPMGMGYMGGQMAGLLHL